MIKREILLQKLIQLDGSTETIMQLLQPFGWDSNQPLIILQRKDIIAVLQMYLQFSISASDVEKWANAIEGREDIGFEDGYLQIISSAINELANPLLTRELTHMTANELIGILQ